MSSIAWRRLALPACATAAVSLLVVLLNANSAAAASRRPVTASVVAGADPTAGAYLWNYHGGYYMGRLHTGETFDVMAQIGAYNQAGAYRDADGRLYRWGRANGQTGTCLWVGPSTSVPAAEYLGASIQTTADSCSTSNSSSVVGSWEWLHDRDNVGSQFNCPAHEAYGPGRTQTTAPTPFYYNLDWNSNYTGGTPSDQFGPALDPGTPLQYRFSTKDGQWAVVWVAGRGWGFVQKNAVDVGTAIGTWNYAGDTATPTRACNTHLDDKPQNGAGSDDSPSASEPAAWSNWVSLGGIISPSEPGVSSFGSGELDVFVRGGQDNQLFQRHYDANGWSDWIPLGGVLTSGPAVIARDPNHLDVFVRATNGEVDHRGWDSTNGWSNWDDLGGATVNGSRIGAAARGSNELDVFVDGTDGELFQKQWTSTAGWGGWIPLGGSLGSGPAAIWRGPNNLDVFARSSSGSLIHKWWDNVNGWSNWEDLGGAILNGPSVSSRAPFSSYPFQQTMDVFARGTNNELFQKSWSATDGWTGWIELGGDIASGPGSWSWSSNRVDVVAAGPSNDLLQKHWGSP